MHCTRCTRTILPKYENMQQVNLKYIGIMDTVKKLRCTNCNVCIRIQVNQDGWKNLDSVLFKVKGNGWAPIGGTDELLKFFILNQIVCNEIEKSCQSNGVIFEFPDKTDVVKMLWHEGNAIGFYTVKLKGSMVNGQTMDAYEMTTLDTAYIRESYRRKGYGLSILVDIVTSFPDECIGISTPISTSMYAGNNVFYFERTIYECIRKMLQENKRQLNK